MASNTKSSEAYVEKLFTGDMTEAALEFRNNIDEFDDAKRLVERATTKLLSTWVGRGRNMFETQHTLLFGQLGDIQDTLYDIYEALVDSQTNYYNTDEELRKQIKLSMD